MNKLWLHPFIDTPWGDSLRTFRIDWTRCREADTDVWAFVRQAADDLHLRLGQCTPDRRRRVIHMSVYDGRLARGSIDRLIGRLRERYCSPPIAARGSP